MIKKINLNKLVPNPLNPNVMSDEVFEKLKKNIKNQKGKYPAIIVREIDGKYRIIDGHNRRRALKELGYKEAKCDVWDV